MNYLVKLAEAIINASQMESKILQNSNAGFIPNAKSTTDSPTAEEQNKHESSVPFGEKIDFSSEPTIEYLD